MQQFATTGLRINDRWIASVLHQTGSPDTGAGETK